MKKTLGVWIDHKKAVIVIVTNQAEELKLMISHVEKRPGRSGDTPSAMHWEPQRLSADDSRQREITGHLNVYYDAVIACIRDADEVLVFGPGEAKGELKERIERSGLGGRVVSVQPVAHRKRSGAQSQS
ncbi:MAG: hypothetical protein NTW86_01365 [Candidatus Sumerlaeota bacterium]|nr:hypothetical protein [Candidatus Sumerlaeota bacterium]